MGLILCPKHGPQGVIINIQQDLVELITGKKEIENNLVVLTENVILEDLGFENEKIRYLVTEEFRNTHDLKIEFDTANEKDEKSIKSRLNSHMGVLCSECMTQYQLLFPQKRSVLDNFVHCR